MTSLNNVLSIANKYDISIESYTETIKYLNSLNEFNLDRDRKYLISFFELERYVRNCEMEWFKNNYSYLTFECELIDNGFAFVDELKIFYKNSLIETVIFLSDEKYDEFMNLIKGE